MTDVRCTVSDCTYWGEGNECKAVKIWITTDALIGADDTEIGDFATVQTPALRSTDTSCKTFKPADSSKRTGRE